MKQKKVGIINLEINNVHSIFEACVEVGYKTKLVEENEKKYNYDIIILPGIGSYKIAMKKIRKFNFKEKILNFLENNNKLLVGICLGMQLFFTKSSEFGFNKGLNLIQGNVKKINNHSRIVPHTGWNEVKQKNNNNIILNKNFNNKFFYFTHSFYCDPKDKEVICGITNYSNFNFCSVIAKNNIFGMQFHPEKSGKDGLKLLKNFQRF